MPSKSVYSCLHLLQAYTMSIALPSQLRHKSWFDVEDLVWMTCPSQRSSCQYMGVVCWLTRMSRRWSFWMLNVLPNGSLLVCLPCNVKLKGLGRTRCWETQSITDSLTPSVGQSRYTRAESKQGHMSSYNWGRRYGRTASPSKWVCFAAYTLEGDLNSFSQRRLFIICEIKSTFWWMFSEAWVLLMPVIMNVYFCLDFPGPLLKSLCHKLYHLCEDLTGLLHIIQAAFQMQKRGVFLIVVTRGLTSYIP